MVTNHPTASSLFPESSEAAKFWSGYQPGFRFTDHEIGSPEFFAAVEQHRYRLEPAIRELVHFPEWRHRNVLEAGCGIATDGINFARHGANYIGVDFSPTAIGIARRRFEAEGFDQSGLRPASITPLPVGDETQDLVYSNGVIHHITDTQSAVDEMHRVLRPGGRAIVMLYHRRSLNYHVNIMLIRRALAPALRLRGVSALLMRLTGEDRGVLDGHRMLFARYGTRYLSDRQLFLSNNTDGPGNPLSKVYTRREAHELFAAFSEVRTHVRFLNLRLYPGGAWMAGTCVAGRVERRVGWHLWIEATK